MTTKPITNQRTKKEIREEVAKIDKEVPETKKFVEIMTAEEQKKEIEENPETTEEETETPENEEELEIPEEEEPLETEEEPEGEEPETPEIPQVPQPKKELPPIEDRYREAGQEAMILNSKNKKFLETVEEAENIPDPTIDELKEYAKQMGSEYDDLDAFAQNVLKENLLNKKRFGKISGLVAEEKQVAKWVGKVESFLTDETTIQKYPALSGLTDEFIKYATKKNHINADLDLLVAGFMWKQPNKPVKRSVLLPRSRGGAGVPIVPVSTDLTEDDAMVYRKKGDFKKYKQLIRQKKIKTTI